MVPWARAAADGFRARGIGKGRRRAIAVERSDVPWAASKGEGRGRGDAGHPSRQPIAESTWRAEWRSTERRIVTHRQEDGCDRCYSHGRLLAVAVVSACWATMPRVRTPTKYPNPPS